MSDLASVESLNRSAAQLPVHWYFDPRVHEAEQRVLFERGPGYVGHALMVPEVGDFHAIDWMGNGKVLVRHGDGDQAVSLLSNVCRHRQAVMLKGRGNAASIVCPLHRWTYALDGKLLGAPHFAEKPCLDLGATPLQRWNGLLFNSRRDIARDLASLGCRDTLDFADYRFDHMHVESYACNWKTFIEVYLEDYHVVPFHPGLGQFVDCTRLEWQFSDWYSVQTVGVHEALTRPGTPVYRAWHEQVLKYRSGEPPRHGAIWLTYYPNIMVEWYPHVLVISTIQPDGPEACRNIVEFYYPEEIVLFEREFIAAEQAAYAETAIEDAEICMRMTEGRRVLYREGRSETGPYQSPLEDGMQHFHEFLRREVGPLLA